MSETTEDAEEIARFLTVIGEEHFREIVTLDIHGKLDPSGAAGLRHPVARARWLRMLTTMRREARIQLASGTGSLKTDERQRRRRRLDRIELRRDEALMLTRQEQEAGRRARDDRKTARRDAGEAAIERLIAAHGAEFGGYLAEELSRRGSRSGEPSGGEDGGGAASQEPRKDAAPKANPTCPECGKESFPSRLDASRTATFVQRRTGGRRMENYPCPVTPGRFHIGHGHRILQPGGAR